MANKLLMLGRRTEAAAKQVAAVCRWRAPELVLVFTTSLEPIFKSIGSGGSSRMPVEQLTPGSSATQPQSLGCMQMTHVEKIVSV